MKVSGTLAATLAVIAIGSVAAAAKPIAERLKWEGHDNCIANVMLETRDRQNKSGSPINEPKIMIYAEDVKTPCMRGPVASTDLRNALLYYVEANRPDLIKHLRYRLRASSTMFALPQNEERYKSQGRDYSVHAGYQKERGVRVIKVTDFVYEPGVFADREDRRAEHDRIYKTYHTTDKSVEW